MAETITLWCEIGQHEWERSKSRGAKPKNCPEHKPVKEALDPEERIRRQQEGRRVKQEAKDKLGIEQVLSYREWVKEDALLWAKLKSGEIDSKEWRALRPPMPVAPDKAAYDAARRVGLAPVELDEDDDD